MKTLPTTYFLGFATLLLALRLLHFGPEIDAPHDWRQCDTAYYILDFFQNGIDLMHPAVCWMGASDTVALEFPLPEAIVALFYKGFGESIPLARFVFLSFFAGAVFYFYKTADLLFGRSTAQLATLVYLSLPLSLFYSRAIHIDFAVVLVAHAMFYYYLLGVSQKRWQWLLLSSIFAGLTFVIKAPYAFYLALPMAWYAYREKALGWVVKSAIFYLIALIPFVFWQQHVNEINGAAPDLFYIKHFRKMTQAAHWYFGSWEQRLTPYHWKVLAQRCVFDVAGGIGVVFLLVGLRRWKQLPHGSLLLIWLFALAAYVLIFFNLNVVHNYYQIPLLAPVAIGIAWGLQQVKTTALTFGLLGLLAAGSILYAELFYYKINNEHVETAKMIRENTPDSALVIVTFQNMDCRDPRILYRAQRRGWSVEEDAVNDEVIRRLTQEQGAGYWAHFRTKGLPDTGMRPVVEKDVPGTGLRMLLYKLDAQNVK